MSFFRLYIKYGIKKSPQTDKQMRAIGELQCTLKGLNYFLQSLHGHSQMHLSKTQ